VTEAISPSHDDHMFDVHYGHWYNLKCERLYRRFDVMLSFVQLVGGSGAALAVINQSSGLLGVVGVCLAVAATLSLLVQPAAKAEAHARAKRAYTRLMAEGIKLDADALALRVAEVRVEAPTGPTALEAPAYNATLRATGRDTGFMRQGPLGWLANAIA